MALTQAELDEVGARIRTQAATKPMEELIATVQRGIENVAEAANAIDADAFTLAPAGEEWTPLDCLTHLIESNTINARQILYVALSGELPPEEKPELPSTRAELLTAHQATMDSLYEHVREADPEANLDIRWRHQFFGDLNWREWFTFLNVHCFDHTRQLKAMQSA